MKKSYLAVICALIIALACVPVFAAGTGTLTIENATPDKTYSVYKIFDLTHSGDAYAYSIGTTSPWYDAVSEDSPFELTKIETSDNRYNVSFADDAVAFNWLKAQAAAIEAGTLAIDADDSKTAGTSNLEFTGLDYGYYFVTSELGSVVTISNFASDIKIIDKNQAAGLTGKEVSATGAADSWAVYNNAGIGDTVYFRIKAFVPKYNGDKKVYAYTFTDTLGDGLTLEAGSVELKIGNSTLLSPDHYEFETIGQDLSIILKTHGSPGYPTNANVEISYRATVNKDAVHENTNSVSMSWTQFDPATDPSEPGNLSTVTEEDPPAGETSTYVYGFELNKYREKVDADNILPGARFKLYDAASAGNEIKLVNLADGQYRRALSTEDGVEITAGTARIFGLATGTYWLEETRAPDGYNQLTSRREVEITEGNSGTDGYLADSIDIINKAGITLPVTGGIGTYIFYISGSLLVLAALVIFYKKTRPSFTKKLN
ncbi:MAG: SpaH/EbpB family LPXTG-anchored major pilin [Clostridiaceae bacterium]|nr:SpaH/EbpB family LPXTG-anchored major pilin [Clostridiaceae bacterium]